MCLVVSLLLVFAPVTGLPDQTIFVSTLAALLGVVLGLDEAVRAWGRLNGRFGLPGMADLASRRAMKRALAANIAVLGLLMFVLLFESLLYVIADGLSHVN